MDDYNKLRKIKEDLLNDVAKYGIGPKSKFHIVLNENSDPQLIHDVYIVIENYRSKISSRANSKRTQFDDFVRAKIWRDYLHSQLKPIQQTIPFQQFLQQFKNINPIEQEPIEQQPIEQKPIQQEVPIERIKEPIINEGKQEEIDNEEIKRQLNEQIKQYLPTKFHHQEHRKDQIQNLSATADSLVGWYSTKDAANQGYDKHPFKDGETYIKVLFNKPHPIVRNYTGYILGKNDYNLVSKWIKDKLGIDKGENHDRIIHGSKKNFKTYFEKEQEYSQQEKYKDILSLDDQEKLFKRKKEQFENALREATKEWKKKYSNMPLPSVGNLIKFYNDEVLQHPAGLKVHPNMFDYKKYINPAEFGLNDD
jgi:hypothetical protein